MYTNKNKKNICIQFLLTILYVKESFGLFKDETFDFIIVGVGSAGCVLVNKLSSNPKNSVLALENGGYPSILSRVPAFATFMYFTNNNYRYKMEKQTNMSLGMVDQRMLYSAGNGLGGSSLINFNMYISPHRKVYDEWAEAGSKGWDSETMLKYAREFENVHISNVDAEYRGSKGPLDIRELPYKTKALEAFLQGAKQMNMYINPDYNGEKQQEGVGYLQSNLRKGERCDAYTAFVKPIQKRKNLKIRIFSKVVRIIIDPETKKAKGVIYFQTTTYSFRKAYAKKEVILSAGVLNSPKILMLSGIGPKEHLESHKIKVIKDLPVGKLMKEHTLFPGVYFTANESVDNIFWTTLNPINYVKLFRKGEGPLVIPSCALEAVGFINTKVTNSSSYPDIELMFISSSVGVDYGLAFRNFFGLSKKSYDELYKSTENKKTWTVAPLHFYPKSSGCVQIKSKNPFDDPVIIGNHYSDPERVDIRTMVAAIRFIQKLSKIPALQAIRSEQVIPEVSGCKHTKLDSDEYWECLLRRVISTLWHETGTCKMGPDSDKTAVVDNELRVRGIKGLRVVDNSIAPSDISCHTNALAITIGYKAADLIMQQYK